MASLIDYFLRPKSAGDTEISYAMQGRLVASSSGWLLLTVPNNLVRGVFDSMGEPGIELPPHNDQPGQLNAHISVIRKDELDAIGGADKITERGHVFHYTLGQLRTTTPSGWPEMSRVWMLEIKSPELEKLRKSYGLSALPNNNQFAFHITCAVRRKHVLRDSEVVKHSSLLGPAYGYVPGNTGVGVIGEACPHCGARLERGDNGDCNRCGKPWPKQADFMTRQEIIDAAKNVNTSPTEAQQEAGNYQKAHIHLHGLDIAIENPKGSTRSGTSASGKQWSIVMKHAYGYIKGMRRATNGKEKKAVRDRAATGIRGLESDEVSLSQPDAQAVPGLWGPRDTSMSKLAEQLSDFLVGHGLETARVHTGTAQESPGIFSEKLLLGDSGPADAKQAEQQVVDVSQGEARLVGHGGQVWPETRHVKNASGHLRHVVGAGTSNSGRDGRQKQSGTNDLRHDQACDRVGKRDGVKSEYDYATNQEGQLARELAKKIAAVSYGPTADGDHLDCFIGDNPESQLVFVVDQINPTTGRFDEHKAMLGFLTYEDAEQAYLGNYEKDWQGLGDMTAMTFDQFRTWLADGSQNEPLQGQTIKLAATYYHGSPVHDIQELHAGSYVTPDQRIAEIMGMFYPETGKTWKDNDLAQDYGFEHDIHFKPGREPTGKPTVYQFDADPATLDLLNNRSEHKTLGPVAVTKSMKPKMVAQ